MNGDIDIVERLRSQANDLRQGALYSPSEDPSWDATTDAADEIERLRAEREAERQHADHLAEVLRLVVRDWCPSSVRVPILDEHEARREQ